MKKLFAHKFTAGASTAAPQKTVTRPDGSVVELVAFALLPASPFRTSDSRSHIEYSYDALALIALHAAQARSTPLDAEHGSEFNGTDTRARGWSHSLSNADLEPDVGFVPGILYGWYELTALGKEEHAAKFYGSTSAVAMGIQLAKDRVQFTRIKSNAWTNNPANAAMPMNFSADDGVTEAEFDLSAAARYTVHLTNKPTDEPMLANLLKKLGLAADADEATALAAIATLTGAQASSVAHTAALTAAGFADATAVSAFAVQAKATADKLVAADAQVATLTTELSALKAADVDRTALAAVDAAIVATKITPAQREPMLAFARLDINAFNTAMGVGKAILPAGTAPAPAAVTQTVAMSQEVLDYVTSVVGASRETYEAGSK